MGGGGEVVGLTGGRGLSILRAGKVVLAVCQFARVPCIVPGGKARCIMTSFEQTLLKEVTALPEARRADVLAFVRYLRLSLMDEVELERRYDAAVASIRDTAARYAITEEDIEAEVRAVRDERARRA